MIKLKNADDQIELELSIVGYQFPDNLNDDWCMVQAIVHQNDNIFEVIDPALETTELLSLLEWFNCLSHLKISRFAHLFFTEPCLEFEFLASEDKAVRIGVTLSHEMMPPFKRKLSQKDSTEWKAAFDLSSNDFTNIIYNIEAVMKEYPIRSNDQAVLERVSIALERQQLYKKMAELEQNDVDKQFAELELKEKRLRARQLKKRGMPLESICKSTGLSPKEVDNL